jgi:membrane protein
MVAVAIGLIYYFAPDAEQLWVWVTPGSLVATCLWLIGSLAFRFYAVNFGHYEATYGTLGGVILLLLWFYMSGLVIVIGAEMNAEIEHTSPWGKAPGEKVPGQRKQIGAAAARTWQQREKPTPTRPSIPNNPAPTPTPAPHPPSFGERLAALLTLFILWLIRRRGLGRRAHTD